MCFKKLKENLDFKRDAKLILPLGAFICACLGAFLPNTEDILISILFPIITALIGYYGATRGKGMDEGEVKALAAGEKNENTLGLRSGFIRASFCILTIIIAIFLVSFLPDTWGTEPYILMFAVAGEFLVITVPTKLGM